MQRARVSNHPCHRLSVPAAKRFWCRHCMMVFEDAITRWRHSRSCRSGGFDNFVRRREIETQALQKMAETLDPEMVTPVAVPSEEGGAGCSKELCCFICRQRFVSLDEMREHVKYPCNKPASLQRPSMTVYIEEPTFGTGIQQHYTDGPASQYQQGSSIPTASAVSAAASSPHPVTVYMNDSEQGHQHSEAKPTNIYVNEKGETVIEVENLDLSTKSGELSLAHLLTQLSQQGIVFDQQPQGETEDITSHHEPQIVQDTTQEIDYSQPTAVDAANTLTQLAGSAFRATSNPQETYTYLPSKRIKTEGVELQYQLEQQEHMQGQTYFQKDEPADQPEQEKYIICTNDSEVISVVRADDISSENSNSGAVYQNGPVSEANDQSGSNHIQATLGEANSEQTVIFQGQPDQDSHTVVLHSTENGTAETSFASTPMIVLEDQPQVHAVPTGQLIKCEDPSDQLVITAHSASGVEQTGELAAVQPYHSEQSTAAMIRTVNISQEREEAKSVLITSASSREATTTLTSDKAVTGLLHSSGEPAIVRIPDAAQVDTPAESALLLPPIVPITSPTSDSNQVILQHEQNTGSSEENNLIRTPVNDGSTSSMKCDKVVHGAAQLQTSEKKVHERIVTRSVSVLLQNQKMRVLRSRSLPVLHGGVSHSHCQLRKKIQCHSILKETMKPSLVHEGGDNLLPIKKNKTAYSFSTRLMMTELCAEDNIPNRNKAKNVHLIAGKGSFQESDSKVFDIAVDDGRLPEKRTHSSLITSVSSKSKQCKCIICGAAFKNSQILQRHRRVPCRVKHTRTMSQKILRPRSASMCRTPLKVQPRGMHVQEDRKKPKLLLTLVPHSKLSQVKTSKKETKVVYVPVTEPREPEIFLLGKRLPVSSLSWKEQHMARLGLVSTEHMMPAVLLRHQTVLRSKAAIVEQRQQEASTVQFPSLTSLPHFSNDCIENELGNDSGSSSPPILERIDLTSNCDTHTIYSEPPDLEPMVFLHSTGTTGMETTTFDWEASKTSKSKNADNSCEKVECGHAEVVQAVITSPVPLSLMTKITIKSLTSGLRLSQGGEIIIRTSFNKDRILLINPESSLNDSKSMLNNISDHASQSSGHCECEQSFCCGST